MRIFLTGATGFIGSRLLPELIGAGHEVLGLTRSDAGAQGISAAGGRPHHGTLEDVETLKCGAEAADAVIHCAFDHDFANFMANCEKDARAVTAMGEVLKGSDRPFIITSGVGFGDPGDGGLAREDVFNTSHPNPRMASEAAGAALLEAGTKVIVMRLPQVHDPKKQGLVSPFIEVTRQKGVAAYVGEGANRWSAAHVSDVAKLYKLAVEQGKAGERFHAVDEEGVSARAIAETIGKGLNLPVVALTPEQAGEHFGWMAMFVTLDMPASSAWTRQRLGWTPTGPGLIADLERVEY